MHFEGDYSISDTFLKDVAQRVYNRCEKIPYKKPENDDALEHPTTKARISRSNHGTAHGVRQGFLAWDILDLPIKIPPKVKVFEEKRFKQLMILASALQRTGRESEDSDVANLTIYFENSGHNFEQEATGMFPDIDPQLIMIFKKAFVTDIPSDPSDSDSAFIKSILDAAHFLDLTRIYHVESVSPLDHMSIRDRVCKSKYLPLEAFFQKLLFKAYAYLSATGFSAERRARSDVDLFFKVSLDPNELVNSLLVVRSEC